MAVKNEKGRPTKLTPERQHKILQAIEAGSYLNTACAYAGVSYKVFREWMIKGEGAKSGIYRDFREAVEFAEAKAEIRMISQWQSHMKDDWRSTMEYLARRFPDRWSNTQKIQLQVQQQVESEINLLFEAIASDPEIPSEIKHRVFNTVSTLQDQVAVAGDN